MVLFWWPQCEGIWRPPLLGLLLRLRLEEHFERGHAERQGQGAIAVVGVEPS